MLLPAEVRCRTAFTTYEHDPYRLQGLRSTQSQRAQLPLQIVVTLSRAEEGVFKFQHDEYHAQFAIFNFVEQRFSPHPSPSAYAQYVADCCLHSRIDRVAPVHTLITALEVGREPEQWDRLLPAVSLEKPGEPQMAPYAEEALANVDTLKQFRRRHTRPQRDPNGVQAYGFRRLSRLALMAALAAFSLLGAGVILQHPLVSKKLKEYTTRSGQSPAVVLPQSPAWREPPLLPQSPVYREPPLLPQSPVYREPSASRR
jgi:hypothetical protein